MAGRELTTLVAVTMLAGALRFATLGLCAFVLATRLPLLLG